MTDTTSVRTGRSLALPLLALAFLSPFCIAADDQPPSNEKLWEDMVHYGAIDHDQLFNEHVEALLAAKIPPQDAFDLSARSERAEKALYRLLRRAGTEDAAKSMLVLIAEGRRIKRADKEAIVRDVEKLSGTSREIMNARTRLRQSGEFTVPYLLAYLGDPSQVNLHAEIINTLGYLGLPAVNPLCQATQTNEHTIKLHVIQALADLGYAQALPYLKDVADEAITSGPITDAAARAISKISSSALSIPASDLYMHLAERYYAGDESVAADPRQRVANVWYYDERAGLTYMEVDPRLYNDIMIMRSCELALARDKTAQTAVSLWLTANFQREMTTKRHGLKDPTRTNELDAHYFATAAGPEYCFAVLDRALNAGRTGVALGAIMALQSNCGEDSLHKTQLALPLLRALSYPDRAVRFNAAFAIAGARPRVHIAGVDRVVPVLAEALHQVGNATAALVVSDQDNHNRLKGAFSEEGWVVIDGSDLEGTLLEARQAPSTDAILLSADIAAPTLAETIAMIRRDFNTRMVPVIILANEGNAAAAQAVAEGDPLIEVFDEGEGASTLLGSITALSVIGEQTSISPTAATDYALRSLDHLHKMALSGSTVIPFQSARSALIAATGDSREEIRLGASNVLALMDGADSQRAIGSLAFDESVSKEGRLATLKALADSAKYHGYLISDDQISQLVEMALRHEDLDLRSAAAEALGAMNMPANEAGKLIQEQSRDK